MSKITRLFDLADGLYKSSDLKWAEAQKVVTIVIDSLAEAIQKGERVELRGFGSFGFQHRRAGPRRNPRTGQKVQVPDRCVPRFKPAKELRALLNEEEYVGFATEDFFILLSNQKLQESITDRGELITSRGAPDWCDRRMADLKAELAQAKAENATLIRHLLHLLP